MTPKRLSQIASGYFKRTYGRPGDVTRKAFIEVLKRVMGLARTETEDALRPQTVRFLEADGGTQRCCPFCEGSEQRLARQLYGADCIDHQDDPAAWGYFIECGWCHARGGWFASANEALNQWNEERC